MFILNWLGLQIKLLRNGLKKDKKNFVFKDLWHGLLVLSGLALIFLFFYSMLRFLTNKSLPAFDFVFIFFSFSLLVFMPLAFYSAVICGLSFFFQREEVHFYFSLPVSRAAVFSVKFLQTYFHAAWMGFLGLITLLAAVQIYFKMPLLIYLTGAISFLAFILIPVCLAVIVVFFISRFIPFVKAKGILTVIGLLTGSVLISIIRLMRPERLFTSEGKMQLITFVQYLHKPWMTVLPSEWVTNILFAQAQSDYRGLFSNFLCLAFTALALLITVYFMGKKYYAKIWAEAQLCASGTKFALQKIVTNFSPALAGFIRKDLLSLDRNTVEKGSLLILIPLSFVYLYSMHILDIQVKNTQIGGIFPFLYIYLFNFFYSSVVISGLSGRWVFPSVSLEGNNFRLIRASPALLRDFIKAKFVLGFVPLLLLGEFLILGSSLILRLQFSFILLSGLTMAVLCCGIILICLILGMREADFSINDPLNFALSYRGFLCLIWEFIFAVIIITLTGIPLAIFLQKGISKLFILFLIFSVLICLSILRILYLAYKSSIIQLSKKEI